MKPKRIYWTKAWAYYAESGHVQFATIGKTRAEARSNLDFYSVQGWKFYEKEQGWKLIRISVKMNPI